MKKLPLLFLLFASLFTYSQIRFEKGYFITNTGEHYEVLIKNVDWKNNPSAIDYKLNAEDQLKRISVDQVQLFEVYNQSKYVSGMVDIDRSPSNLDQMSDEREPTFIKEKIFLKEIVSGDATLYEYTDGNLTRFFIKRGTENIIQLIHKPYLHDKYSIAYNDAYKEQLKNMLVCTGIKDSSIDNMTYKKNALEKVFLQYNNCNNPDYQPVIATKRKGKFNVSVRPRLTISDAETEKPSPVFETKFESKNDFGIGVELEYVLPFNKNKWSIILEPTYRTYRSEVYKSWASLPDQIYVSTIEYQSLQFPIGLRHYFFINQKSKIFINGVVVIDAAMDAKIEQKGFEGYVYNTYEIKTKPNIAFGAGYNFNNKFGAEVRYFTSSNITSSFVDYRTNYKALSFILSYNFL